MRERSRRRKRFHRSNEGTKTNGHPLTTKDTIEIADDRQTATARVHVIVHLQRALDPDCTLVEMAQAQGEGIVRAALPAVLEHTYVRRGGTWKILRTCDSRAMA